MPSLDSLSRSLNFWMNNIIGHNLKGATQPGNAEADCFLANAREAADPAKGCCSANAAVGV